MNKTPDFCNEVQILKIELNIETARPLTPIQNQAFG